MEELLVGMEIENCEWNFEAVKKLTEIGTLETLNPTTMNMDEQYYILFISYKFTHQCQLPFAKVYFEKKIFIF